MSRGPGWVERRIATLFAAREWSFTTGELAALVYGVMPEKKHRVAVLRAAYRIMAAHGRGAYYMKQERSNEMLFVYQLDEDIYLAGRTRASAGCSRQEAEARIREPPFNDYWAENYAEWRRECEIHRLQAAGDPRANELARKLAEERAARYRMLMAMIGRG